MTPQQETRTTPGIFDGSFAASLRASKKEIVGPSGDDGQASIAQFGAAYIDATITLPDPPADRAVTEPLIDMFVCRSDGSCEATGADAVLGALWQPAVSAMADAVFSALQRFDVPVAPVAYVTASFTPGSDVVGEAHLDDDQYLPDAGVGVVAIVGSDVGPRVATKPVTVLSPRPGLPLGVEQATFDQFTAGELHCHQAEAGRILVFPQFGQLHAGPALASTNPDKTRRLLVFRAETEPVSH